MYKYYLKKVSKQDVSKTTVINNEAARTFFNLSLAQRDEFANVTITYLPDIVTDVIRVVKKQDIRIFLDKSRFRIGDILLFSKNDDDELFLEIINSDDPRYDTFSINLNNRNFMLTNILPDGGQVGSLLQKSPDNLLLNQILFGPPGTGKTDSTIEKSLEILGRISFEPDEQTRRKENRDIFRSLLNKRIFFVTMHPSYSYEDFVQGIKPVISDNKELLFEYKNGIFKRVSEEAKLLFQKCKLKRDPGLTADFDTLFSFAFSPLLLGDVSFIEIPRQDTPFKIIDINDRRLRFETSTGVSGPTYNLSRLTLKKIYERGVNDIILSGNSTYYNSLLEFLNQKVNELRDVKLVNQSDHDECDNIAFVLILDEINRANISKVFGELITLVEEDKRIGNENELSVTLPSGEIFSVPPNLFIIGTMNTADKSIALVDIALRRRFQFIPVYPDSSIITNFCKSADKADKALFMDSLNTRLRVDKGVDFQIGHAYFLKDNLLADVINENVIPLLTEYYRNDLEKVKKLLSDLGKPIDENYYTKTGLLKYI